VTTTDADLEQFRERIETHTDAIEALHDELTDAIKDFDAIGEP